MLHGNDIVVSCTKIWPLFIISMLLVTLSFFCVPDIWEKLQSKLSCLKKICNETTKASYMLTS